MHPICRLILLVATAVGCRGQNSSASAPQFRGLPLLRVPQQGITPFLQANSNYSLFLEFLESDSFYGAQLAQAWSQGPTNNTLLIPTNNAVEAGFERIGSLYGIDGNASTYVELVTNSDSDPVTQAAKTLVAAILGSHVLTSSVAFYSNATIQAATVDKPVALPVSRISTASAPLAYSVSEGVEERVAVFQPSGIFTDPIMIPKQYINQKGGASVLNGAQASLYLYEVPSILIAAEIVSGNGLTSVSGALETLAAAD